MVQSNESASSRWFKMMPVIFLLLWSTGFIGARLGMPYAEPFSFLALRFGLVTVLVAIMAMFMGSTWPNRRDSLHAFIAGVFIHGIYLGGVFWSIDRGMPAGVSALIVGLQPILTAFLACWFLKEELNWRHWLGLFIGLMGVAMVLAPKLDISGSGITIVTIAASFIGALSITIGSVYQKKYATGLDLMSGATWQYAGATAATFIAALIARETFTYTWTIDLIVAFVWLVVVLSIGAITLYMIMIRHGQVSKIAGVFYLVPAVTALIGWLMFNETLNLVQLAGMAVCAFAVAMIARSD
ncbi:MAG: DMT family transporter [Hyphomicrobiales bacterium]